MIRTAMELHMTNFGLASTHTHLLNKSFLHSAVSVIFLKCKPNDGILQCKTLKCFLTVFKFFSCHKGQLSNFYITL